MHQRGYRVCIRHRQLGLRAGPPMIDLQDPQHPACAGCFVDLMSGVHNTGYTQDVQCVIHHIPVIRYTERRDHLVDVVGLRVRMQLS